MAGRLPDEKTENGGQTSQGRLSAVEFNAFVEYVAQIARALIVNSQAGRSVRLIDSDGNIIGEVGSQSAPIAFANQSMSAQQASRAGALGTAADNITKEQLVSALAGKSAVGHTHTKSQITDFPTSLPASGGTADLLSTSNPSYPQVSGDDILALAEDIEGRYVKPSGGIPSSDLASAVRQSLSKADAAMQEPSVEGSSGQVLTTNGLRGRTWKDINHLRPQTYDTSGTTVGEHKAALAVAVNGQKNGVGDNITVSGSVVEKWDDESARTYPSISYSFIKTGGGYGNSQYGQWLLSSYDDNRLGVVGRSGNVWSGINWLAWKSDVNSLEDSLSRVARTGAFADLTGRGEAHLEWGGKNYADGFSPVDAALFGYLGANRSMFMPPECIDIEYSRDGGATWTDYEAGDDAKTMLFSVNNGVSFSIGKADSSHIATNQYQLRVIMTTSRNGLSVLYTELNKFMMYVSTNGTGQNWVTIDARLQTDVEGDNDRWTVFADKVRIDGWSGWNVVNTQKFRTYGNTEGSQYGQVRFTFGCDVGSTSTYTGLKVYMICCYGGMGWATPSRMANNGVLFDYDYRQGVTFPGDINTKGGIYPYSGEVHNLGSSTLRWKDIYARSIIAHSPSTVTSQYGDASVTFGSTVARGIPGLFPVTNNANALVTINRHSGDYYSQIGLSSDGNIYYRCMNGQRLDAVTPWRLVAWSGFTAGDSGKLAKFGSDGTLTPVAASDLSVGWAESSNNANTLDGHEYTEFQPTLVSGVNIKTVNGNSLLGAGNIVIQGGGGDLHLRLVERDMELVIVSQSQLDTDNLTLSLMRYGRHNNATITNRERSYYKKKGYRTVGEGPDGQYSWLRLSAEFIRHRNGYGYIYRVLITSSEETEEPEWLPLDVENLMSWFAYIKTYEQYPYLRVKNGARGLNIYPRNPEYRDVFADYRAVNSMRFAIDVDSRVMLPFSVVIDNEFFNVTESWRAPFSSFATVSPKT